MSDQCIARSENYRRCRHQGKVIPARGSGGGMVCRIHHRHGWSLWRAEDQTKFEQTTISRPRSR